jgi:hypothetical protein
MAVLLLKGNISIWGNPRKIGMTDDHATTIIIIING